MLGDVCSLSVLLGNSYQRGRAAGGSCGRLLDERASDLEDVAGASVAVWQVCCQTGCVWEGVVGLEQPNGWSILFTPCSGQGEKE